MESITDLNKENTLGPSRYSVSGSRQGEVTVKDVTTGEVIRTFQMDSEVVVRETFLLDGGQTVAASQKDHAVFWDLTTGEEIHRFPQRIYGFTRDESKFFTFEVPGSKVCLYSYPDLTFVCQLSDNTSGPQSFRFSPDERFLVIRFMTGFPSTDKNYPKRNHVTRGFIYTKLFNIQDCQEISEFSRL
ncbi:WD40 repeat domain-containing protein, partial [Microcoleus sp. herbarium12]|uniref:WD40 repeat domain-containing protein n=1 Tax=Microcoleus sp. herbarium12 TaxID=3055437 RepID=UPI002FD14B80